jgi:hypothetical protein
MNSNNSQPAEHGSGRMWLMMLACLVPLGIVLAMGTVGLSSSTGLIIALVVICPLMMLLMMSGGGHGGEQSK